VTQGGIALVQMRDKHRESIPTGSLSTVFQSEVMAILMRTALLCLRTWRKEYISALITRQ